MPRRFMLPGVPSESDIGGRASVDGQGFSTIQEAIEAAETAGGGTITVRPGTYNEEITLTGAADRVQLCGHGVTLQASANDQTMLTMHVGLSVGNGARAEGFRIDGNGFTGVTGVNITDSVNAAVSDLYVHGCETGMRFGIDTAAGTWTEYCGADRVFVYDCEVGIDYVSQVTPGTQASFAECWLSDVGVTDSRIGIRVDEDAFLTRVTWNNVTSWQHDDGDIGYIFGGMLDMCRLEFHAESFVVAPADTVGIHVTSTADWWGNIASAHLSCSFVGEYSDTVINDSSVPVAIRNGAEIRSHGSASMIRMFEENDLHPRTIVDHTGVKLGDGSGAPTAAMVCDFADYVTMTGRFFFALPLALNTDAASGPVGSVVRKIEVWDKDTGLSAGWIPVYDSIT
jgi:hypothetical protein